MIKNFIKFVCKKINIYNQIVNILIILEKYTYKVFWNNFIYKITHQIKDPLPSLRLRNLVSGNYSVEWFLTGGAKSKVSIENVLKEGKVDISTITDVLDFGCGCSRVLIHLKSYQHLNLHGCDYNPLLVNWSDQNLPYASFKLNNLTPPITFEDESFDLIYQFSVFTHLTESQQDEWLKEFSRILRPQGYMIISTHGPWYRNRILDKDLLHKFDQGIMIVNKTNRSGENDCGSYHPKDYYKNNEVITGFRQLAYIEQGAIGNPEQDIYLLQKI